MHVVLASIGTAGDILPYVAVGLELRARGHQISLAASDNFRSLAAAHEIPFHSLVTEAENLELLGHPDFWNPLKNAFLAAAWGMRYVRRQYELLAPLARGSETFLLANMGLLAAEMVHETRGCPWANLMLQPWMVPSCIAPPVMPLFRFPKRTPVVAVKTFWRLLDVFVDRLIGRQLNSIRLSLGLPPKRRVLSNWLSKQLVLGMFPEWFAPPQKDWPSQLQLVGFPLFDGHKTAVLPAALEGFLAQSKPTVTFTFGTGMMHARHLFAVAAEACERMGVQGIFLTRHMSQLPATLPSLVRHCEFASFSALFSKCAAVVHHGGIGTIAQALAAGTPQLVLPFAYDQMDNAERVKHLGAGDYLNMRRVNASQLSDTLAEIMGKTSRERARRIAAARFGAGSGEAVVQRAAMAIERLSEKCLAST